MADSTKAPKGLLISGLIALLVGLGGCAGGAAVAAGPVLTFVRSLSDLQAVVYGEVFEFAGTGSTAAVVTSGQALCTARDDAGTAVRLAEPGNDFTSSVSNEQGDFQVNSTFPTLDGALYQVTCDGEPVDGQFAVISFPGNGSAILAGLASGGLGGLLTVIGIGLLIASLISRSRWKKARQPVTSPPAPGSGYGGPAAPGAADPASPTLGSSPPPPSAPFPVAPAQYPTEPPQAPPSPPSHG